MPRRAILRVHGHGDVTVASVQALLEDVRRCYASLFLLDGLFSERRSRYLLIEGFLTPYISPLGALTGLPGRILSTDELETFVPLSTRLTLKSVILSSPGDWDFLGALNPLEVIRKALNDRHERRKDREYKEPAERERLSLENELLRTRLIAEQIRLAKELGASDRDLAPLLNRLLFDPLQSLGRHQDEGLIDDAEIFVQPDDGGDEG